MNIRCTTCAVEHSVDLPRWLETSERDFRFHCAHCGAWSWVNPHAAAKPEGFTAEEELDLVPDEEPDTEIAPAPTAPNPAATAVPSEERESEPESENPSPWLSVEEMPVDLSEPLEAVSETGSWARSILVAAAGFVGALAIAGAAYGMYHWVFPDPVAVEPAASAAATPELSPSPASDPGLPPAITTPTPRTAAPMTAAPPPITPPPATAAPPPTVPPQPPAAPRPPSRADRKKSAWENMDRGDHPAAAEAFRALLAERPSDAEAEYGYAYALLKMNDSTKAIEHLCHARAGAPPESSLGREMEGLLTANQLACPTAP